MGIELSEEIRRHPSERASVGQVVDKGFMARLAADDDIANVLHYDISNRILSVEEPQLIFYVRHLDWSEFVRQIGFTRIDIAQPYDFALSFAGEDRAFADALEFASHRHRQVIW